jgi:hypothetical protein
MISDLNGGFKTEGFEDSIFNPDNKAFSLALYPEASLSKRPSDDRGNDFNIIWPCPPFSRKPPEAGTEAHKLAKRSIVEQHLWGMKLSQEDLERGWIFHYNRSQDSVVAYRLAATAKTISALCRANRFSKRLETPEDQAKARKLHCLISMQLWDCGSYIAIAKLTAG